MAALRRLHRAARLSECGALARLRAGGGVGLACVGWGGGVARAGQWAVDVVAGDDCRAGVVLQYDGTRDAGAVDRYLTHRTADLHRPADSRRSALAVPVAQPDPRPTGHVHRP